MPNWRKHSARIFLVPSWRSIRAMRATAFLGGATAARAVPWRLSITKAAESSCEPILASEAGFGKDSFRQMDGTKVLLQTWTGGYRGELRAGTVLDPGSTPVKPDYDQRLKTSAPLVPPKPKEFESA